MKRWFVLASLALAGCNATPQSTDVVTTVAFDPSAAAFINTQGPGSIEGHAFLRNADGSTVNASGEIVRLVPVTPYARQRFTQLYRGGKFVAASQIPKIDPDPAYSTYTRTTRAESNGRFTFDHLAPGSYYVATQKIVQKANALGLEGGAFFETVTVTGSTPIEVVVTNP